MVQRQCQEATRRLSFLEEAIEHAKRRWCWDDPSFIQEIYEARFPEDGLRTPAEWIDEMAEDFGLLDPRDYDLVER